MSASGDLTVPQFVTGTFRSHAFRIPDDEYGRALDCLVKACCDVIITVAEEPCEAQSPLQEKIFLGRRQVEPQPDWWFIGGRMMPGETAAQACLRHLKRELGITDVSASKIEHVSTQLFAWDSREQAPKEHGTSDVSLLVNVELPRSALASLVLEEKEYQAAHVFTLEEILTKKLAPGEEQYLPPSLVKLYAAYGGYRFHPAVRRACSDMLAARALRRLKNAIQQQASESAVAAAAREWSEAAARAQAVCVPTAEQSQ